MKSTELETEFIKLTDYSVAPCLACLGCVKTNKCVIEDDGILLAGKAIDVELKGSFLIIHT